MVGITPSPTCYSNMPLKTVPIPVELLHALLDYLSSRPWRETNPLIQTLIQVEKVAEAPKVKKDVAKSV